MVESIQRKILWILSYYSEEEQAEYPLYELFPIFSNHLQSRNNTNKELVLQLIINLCSYPSFLDCLVESDILSVIRDFSEEMEIADIALFATSILEALQERHFTLAVQDFVDFLYKSLTREMRSNNIQTVVAALMNVSTTSAPEAFILKNTRCLESGCIWLLEDENLSKANTPVHEVIFRKLMTLFSLEYESQEFLSLLSHLLHNYVERVWERLCYQESSTVVRALDVMYNVCSNHHFVDYIVGNHNILLSLYTLAEESFNVRKEALSCLCNLFLAGE